MVYYIICSVWRSMKHDIAGRARPAVEGSLLPFWHKLLPSIARLPLLSLAMHVGWLALGAWQLVLGARRRAILVGCSASACASREARGEAEKSGPDADLPSLFAPSPDGGLAVQDVYLYITLGMRRLLGDSSLS